MMTEVTPPTTKQISLLATQSVEPVNTPPWSMAARLPNDAIEQFEQQKEAERKKEKQKQQKRQKRKFLFADSSDEEDESTDDDLEFDLGKPAQRISSLTSIKENVSDESIEEKTLVNHSKHDPKQRNNDKQPPVKKQKVNKENDEVVPPPGRRTTRQVSVNVSRGEVERLMRDHGENVKPPKNTKATETKTVKSNRPKSLQSVDQKKSDSKEDTPDVRKSNRTKKSITNETPPPVREKRLQKNEKTNVDTSSKARNKRNNRKGKADDDDDDENANAKQPPPLLSTVSKTFNPNQIF